MLLWLLLILSCSSASMARSVRSCESKSFVYQREYENRCEFAPANWAQINPQCADAKANRPSPINIGLSVCQSKSPTLRPLQFSPNWLGQTKFVVKNNGHSIQADALNSEGLTVTGGNLKTTFNCLQFHLHWGSAANMEKGIGSEHRLFDTAGNPVPTPMEVHIVCKRLDMSFQQAVNTLDAIAVLGAFIVPQRDGERETVTSRLVDQALSDMSHLFAPVPHGSDPTAEDRTPVELLLRNLLPEKVDRFVNYDGALTTPGCNPVVQWHLFPEPIRVNKRLMLKFTSVYFDEAKRRPMVDNFRPVTGLHGRDIRCSFGNSASPMGLTGEPEEPIEEPAE